MITVIIWLFIVAVLGIIAYMVIIGELGTRKMEANINPKDPTFRGEEFIFPSATPGEIERRREKLNY